MKRGFTLLSGRAASERQGPIGGSGLDVSARPYSLRARVPSGAKKKHDLEVTLPRHLKCTVGDNSFFELRQSHP
jgi:hypothetical protein